MGLDLPKEKRQFPEDVPKEFLRDLIRGFIDARGIIKKVKNSTYLSFEYNHDFLKELHNTLTEHADVKKAHPKEGYLSYPNDDTMRIRDFIYYPRCLCVSSKKIKFEKAVLIGDHANKKQAIEKIEQAKELIELGFNATQISNYLHYTNPSSFFRNFKIQTGMTIGGYKLAISNRKS